MSEIDTPRDNVIRFPVEAVSRHGFHRAAHRPGRRERMEREGQLTLFPAPAGAEDTLPAEVVPLPVRLGPFDEALRLDELGDDGAEDQYLRAVERGDRAADAWCNLGVIRSQSGDLDSAFDCFAQSLALDPMHAESHYNIGNLYFEIGDLRVARTHYEIALDAWPEFANAWFNLGLVTALSEEYRTAYDALVEYKRLLYAENAATDAVADELLGYIRTAMQLS